MDDSKLRREARMSRGRHPTTRSAGREMRPPIDPDEPRTARQGWPGYRCRRQDLKRAKLRRWLQSLPIIGWLFQEGDD